ncbi:MAG: organic solvent ABC transporter [Cycloclasticus sp. symbiont of Poecilosclerida sp. M]|nr:MAG: organic solvent ABC transporter [Cycloclasticus sp. symbiont of Poecilosclerida sp. M]
MKLHKTLITLGLALTFFITAPVVAAELNAPQKVVKGISDQLDKALQTNREKLKSDRKEVYKLVNTIVDPRVDIERISKLILGKKHWTSATTKERKDFQNEFKSLLINTYATAFTAFDDWTIHFIPMNLDKEAKRARIKTEIIQPGKPPIAINYRMVLSKKGSWKVYDVVIEGISMVTNYRSSFASSIKKSGNLSNVIKELAAKNKKTSEQSVTATQAKNS